MSCYEEAIGSWDFPAGGWMKAVKELYEADCEIHNKHWDVAERFYVEAKAEKLRDYRKDFWSILERAKGSIFGWNHYHHADKKAKEPDWFDNRLVFSLCRLDDGVHKDDRKKPLKPQKQQRKKPLKRGFPNSVTFGQGTWQTLEVGIKSRHVRLEIGNGNRSVDRWWQTPLGHTFASILSKTNWTGDKGGYCIHRTEYDNENDFEPSYTFVYGGKKYMKAFRRRHGW